jgi:HEAT repeat protein
MEILAFYTVGYMLYMILLGIEKFFAFAVVIIIGLLLCLLLYNVLQRLYKNVSQIKIPKNLFPTTPEDVEKWESNKDIVSLRNALRYKRDDEVIGIAAKALVRIGNTDCKYVLDSEFEPDEDNIDTERMLQNQKIRLQIINAILEIGDSSHLEYLLKGLQNDDADIQEKASEALAKIGDIKVVEPLIDTLSSWNIRSRIAAANALKKLGHPKWKKLIKGDLKDFQRLGETLDKRFISPLIILLGSETESDRKMASEALVKYAKDVTDPLIKIAACKEDNEDKNLIIIERDDEEDNFVADHDLMKKHAILTLGDIGDTLAVDLLIELLNDPNLELRSAAAESLGKLKDSRAVDPLIALLEDISFFSMKGRLPGKIRFEKEVKSYKTSISGYEHIQHNATEALGKLGDLKAAQALINALDHPHELVRIAAAEALGSLHAKDAVKPLIEVLKDKNEYVRQSAAKALAKLGEKQWSEAVSGDDEDIARLEKMSDKGIGNRGMIYDVNSRIKKPGKKVLKKEKSVFFCFICSSNESIIQTFDGLLTLTIPGAIKSVYDADANLIRLKNNDSELTNFKYKVTKLLGKEEKKIEEFRDVLESIATATSRTMHILFVTVDDLYIKDLTFTYQELLSQAIKQGIFPFPMFFTNDENVKDYLLTIFQK